MLCSPVALGFDNLDIHERLAEPGVKLVAVEFYATWCKPCNDAIPQWISLRQKYRSRGLRVVVVSVQSEGACANPDWTPDAVVCDYDGDLARSWNADQLPQAFLWSWQGDMLVSHGSIGQIRRAVDEYFAAEPRILIAPPRDVRGNPLPAGLSGDVHSLVRSELRRSAKFDIVADAEEKTFLQSLKKQGHGHRYDEETKCRLGMELSPNSLLNITVSQSNKRSAWLALELLSLEHGCLTASARTQVENNDYAMAAAQAVTRLLRQLKGDMQTPEMPETAPVAAASMPPQVAPAPQMQPQPAAPALAPETSAISVQQRRTATEWIAIRAGGGGNDNGFGGYATLSLFTLRWRYFFWELLRTTDGDGTMSVYTGGTLAGFPWHIDDQGRHEIRLGLGVGGGYIAYIDDWSGDEYSSYAYTNVEVNYVWHAWEQVSLQTGIDMMIPVANTGAPIALVFLGFRI